MDAYLAPPRKIPWYLKLPLAIADSKVGKKLLAPRLLAWYPKAAFSSGVMEALVAHGEGAVTPRLLKLVRMQVSMTASCPFCVDMNSHEFVEYGISEQELRALQGQIDGADVESFTAPERLALTYAQGLSRSPIEVSQAVVEKLRATFSEREFVVLATTIAQVNYWTRLIQGLGVPPEGFSETCPLVELERYQTRKP